MAGVTRDPGMPDGRRSGFPPSHDLRRLAGEGIPGSPPILLRADNSISDKKADMIPQQWPGYSDTFAEICPGHGRTAVQDPDDPVTDPVVRMDASLTSDGSAPDIQRENAFPAVDGDRVVWSKRKPYGSANDQDIVFMNLTTGISREICTREADQTEPAISGPRIVWTDRRNEPGGGDIYLFDMKTGIETPVCTVKGLQQRPKISGDSIVWMDYRDGTPAVYLYNIPSGGETRISRDSFVADAPLLSGHLAVWQEYSVFDRSDERAGSIVVYDTATGVREVLPTGTLHPQLLAADKNRILYANPDEKTMEEGYVHLFVIDAPVPPSPSADTVSLPITGQVSPAMVFGPAMIATQSAPGSLPTILVSFIALILISRAGTRLRKK